MVNKWVILVAFVGLCKAAPPPNLKIVNGTDAREGEFPFAVSVRNGLSHICGGTILNNRHVLTAAHCVCADDRPTDPRFYTIQYGSIRISETTERSVQVSAIHCHQFNMATLLNDVAVLDLAQDLRNDGSWQAVRLARRFDTSSETSGIVIGWGRLWQDGPIPQILQKLPVNIYADAFCNVRFDSRQHVCFGAYLGGACNGDSGGALVANNHDQIAVASFITNTCGTANILTPNVYARVSYFYDWIENRIRN